MVTNGHMRWATLLLLASSPLFGQLSRIDVAFEETGCPSCLESLEARLARVRGVERVELDADVRIVKLHLAPNNRVRLTPLLSRITQDGTKILRTHVQGRGAIVADEHGYRFEPTDSAQTYRLRLKSINAKPPHPDVIYEVAGSVSETGPGETPILTAESIKP